MKHTDHVIWAKSHILSIVAAMMLPCALSAGICGLSPAPEAVMQPSEHAVCALLHFWDGTDWCDSTLTADDSLMIEKSEEFYSLCGLTDSITASEVVGAMFAGASADDFAYRRLAEIAAQCLHDPASPMIDDEIYAVVVDRLLADKRLGESERLRLEDAHSALMQNRKGTKAADVAIVTADGTEMNLSDAAATHSRSILIFYDPDCHECADLEHHIASIRPSETGIVMVCPFDTDEDTWRTHAASMPADWIVARPADPGFEDSETYYIPATPTVYLLDSNLTVLSKNLTLKTVDAALAGQ